MSRKKQKNKRTSISRQLTVTFLSIIGIIMLLMFLANTFLLEKFYERRLENTLVSMFEMADEHVTADGLNQTFFNKSFLETTQKNSVIAAITDADYVPVLVYGTGNDSLEILSARLNGYIWGIDQGSQVVKKENNYTIQKRSIWSCMEPSRKTATTSCSGFRWRASGLLRRFPMSLSCT